MTQRQERVRVGFVDAVGVVVEIAFPNDIGLQISSQVLDARIPSLLSALPTLKPGSSRSTMNAVPPR